MKGEMPLTTSELELGIRNCKACGELEHRNNLVMPHECCRWCYEINLQDEWKIERVRGWHTDLTRLGKLIKQENHETVAA